MLASVSILSPEQKNCDIRKKETSASTQIMEAARQPCLVIAQHFDRFLIGEDPFNIETLWDQMYRSTLPYGLGGVTAMAISGVDLALWDLMGKALDQPVYKLLVGKRKKPSRVM